MSTGILNFSWISLSKFNRLDAAFWIKVHTVLKAREVDINDLKAVKAVVSEIEERKEFPGGSHPKVPIHIECPTCLSWEIESTETKITRIRSGQKTVESQSIYICIHCSHTWNFTESS